ncbi:hypothetical protein [Sediminicola luteus]|uniref:Uncharacterized protein n=1 Tax=Sediminicola luteus TaxID=319238 RepID=A0A2A4GB50_9FLAO|nr:hypothetical protein [Sediminicola luteus]PCE65827.1 hypothetical protein B7P33_00540 [Sediminicola luteus]
MNPHSFHIPVMGIGFTLDTPLKVSHLGMDSVISLVDDILLEKMRKVYSEKFQLPYEEITEAIDDFRAKRITAYLNMTQKLVQEKFEALLNFQNQVSEEIKDYFSFLPDTSPLKKEFQHLLEQSPAIDDIKNWLAQNLRMGSIDVNIMTKVDKDNYIKGEKLPTQYNDAHAALRGFAQSELESSVVLSAGMNPRLFAYMEGYDDFYPDSAGHLRKKIILKVSDYRSALIQGKVLAKRGLWVSEYRIESGLNCGGHAFATEGYLLGPVLHEFKEKRAELQSSLHEVLATALLAKGKAAQAHPLPIKITAQGGVGTPEEHQFLQQEYGVDSVGWGSPFLLVPEATTVDKHTLAKLSKAAENDVYLSDISPLGIPFHSLKGNTKDEEKLERIAKGKPGSPCPKKFVALNTEFGKPLCTASRQYQHKKLEQLEAQNLPLEQFQKAYAKIVAKSCTCVGLGTASLLEHGLNTKVEGSGVSICPGPNIAYFSKVMSMNQITDHIYGRDDMLNQSARPHMFMKELGIYLDYLKNALDDAQDQMNRKQEKYLKNFSANLKKGIEYYGQLFSIPNSEKSIAKEKLFSDLEHFTQKLQGITLSINRLLASKK